MAFSIEDNRETVIAILAFLILLTISITFFLITPKRTFKIEESPSQIKISNSNIDKQYVAFKPGMTTRIHGHVLKYDHTGKDLLQLGLLSNLSLVSKFDWQSAQYQNPITANNENNKNIPIDRLANRAKNYVLIPENNAAIKAILNCKITKEDVVDLKAQQLEFEKAKMNGETLKSFNSENITFLLIRSLVVNDTICLS